MTLSDRRSRDGEAPSSWGRAHLLNLPIDQLRLQQLLAAVHTAVENSIHTTIFYVNIHCFNVANRDFEYARLLDDATIVYCDGTGVRLGAAMAGISVPERMTGADWIWDLAAAAAREGMALYLIGGRKGSAEEAAGVLRTAYPALRIAGTAAGYGTTPETIARINGSDADIVLVGMGTPTQEKWIAAHRGEIDAPVVWAVGALFDFVSGRIPRGPRWLTEHGMEWACRLVVEPRKLWRRYVLGNPQFFYRVIKRYWLSRQ